MVQGHFSLLTGVSNKYHKLTENKKKRSYVIKLTKSFKNMKFQMENSETAVPSAATWCCSLNTHYAAEGYT